MQNNKIKKNSEQTSHTLRFENILRYAYDYDVYGKPYL